MKKTVIFLVFNMLLTTALSGQTPVRRTSPRQMFPGLFEAVQTAHVFPDSKTFADAVPKEAPAVILEAWAKTPGVDLKTFVLQHFYIPQPVAAIYKTDSTQSVQQHIASLWSVLQRTPDYDSTMGSLIPLPHKYIVPGGRFREVYYWDSYFTMLGLKESGRTDLMQNILDNFAYLINTYGFIPNGNRTYYLTRSQPPFFSLMVQLLMESGGPAVLTRYRDALEKEYQFWMKGAAGNVTQAHVVHLPNGVVLNRYWDRGDWPREEAWTEDIRTAAQSGRQPASAVYHELRSGAESGWDFSSRWLADGQTLGSIHVTDIIPVDLNCLLYNLEELLATAWQGNAAKTAFYHGAAIRRKNAIQQYCWDRKTGWFYDYDFVAHKHTNSMNLAGMYPLFFKIARKGQADSASRVLRREFLRPGGLVTTATQTGQQWDMPNGWAPLQWVSMSGLQHYQQDTLAEAIAQRWVRLNEKTFHNTGKLLEKYNVSDTTLTGGGGEYPNQDGFGWTNGVLLKILKQQESKPVMHKEQVTY